MIVTRGLLENNLMLGTTLVDTYAKCGLLEKAQQVLEELPVRDVVSWNALIAGCIQHRQYDEALNCYQLMQSKGPSPDSVTFIVLLTACSHAGLLYEGCLCFLLMYQEYGVKPTAEHYDCMVDLLCRVGLLDHAACLINKMPWKPTIIAWTSLLCSTENWQINNLDIRQYLACL